MARTKVVEGSKYISIFTQTLKDAQTWKKRLDKNKNFEVVTIHKSSEFPTYPYKVRARKRGTWFSDERPFRAGLRLLFKRPA